MSKTPNGFYLYEGTLFAVTFSGAQAIRMTDGKLFDPAPQSLIDGLVVAQVWAHYALKGTKELKPGYGIQWDLEAGGSDWCVVGDLA